MVRFRPFALVVAALAACGGDEAPPTPRQLPAGMVVEGSLLRLPRDGGSAQLLRPDSLTPLPWRLRGSLPPIARALGTDLEERTVYAVDTLGRLIGLDLEFQQWRVHLASARQLTATQDGIVFGLDSTRHPMRFAGRALTTFRASVENGPVRLLRAPSSQVAAYSPGSGTVQLLGEEGEVRRFAVPQGEVTTTWYGDLLAVTTDTGIALVSPAGRGADSLRFKELRGHPAVAVFSPSGHRLYVARNANDLVAFDRFSFDEAWSLDLPGSAAALRIDRSGRWLLAKPIAGDSVWVIDLVRREVTATVRTPWGDDLPMVTAGRTLVTRDGKDVVAMDIAGAGGPSVIARLVDAAGDLFLAVPWLPRGVVAEPVTVATTPADGDSSVSVPDSTATPPPASADAPAQPPAAAGDPGAEVYLQVSASQNEEFAKTLAGQLKDGGFPARVLPPKGPGEPYRVVVGPYPTREEAEAVGRRLGRSYFILTPGTKDT